MTGKRQQPRGSKPTPLADRYTYITSVKAGNRTIAWLAIDRKSKRVVVACPVGKARLLSLKNVKGLEPGHLAPIVRLLRTPDSSQLPADLGSSRPVGIAIADYVPGDTLHARLKVGKLSPIDAVNMCAQVVRAVKAMHDAGTPHGAISPRSIVVSPKGKWSAPVVTQLIAPTSGAFSSRERLQKRGPSVEDDSWAAHATLHAALTAEGPFAGKTREELLQNMFGSKPRRLDEFGVDEPELQKIIDRGLVTNPRYRASLEQLEKALQEWLEEKGRAIQSMPPDSAAEPMFPKEDANAIMLSEPPPSRDEGSAAVPLPRPHGKSLIGIVIDEPLDADAPAFAAPQRPEDLLDAVDDEDGGNDDDDQTRIYDPSRGQPLPTLPRRPPRPERTARSEQADEGQQAEQVDEIEEVEEVESEAADEIEPAPEAVTAAPYADFPAPQPPAKSVTSAPLGSPGLPGAHTGAQVASAPIKTKSSGVSGSGQALAAALALAVAAVVTVFVRSRNDGGSVAVQPAASAAASVTPAQRKTACVADYFPEGSIDPARQDYSFVCRAVDLRSTTKQIEKRLTDGGTKTTTEGAKAWQKLGWFELPLAASMRHNCCEKHLAERIVLPQPPPNCKALSAVLKQMTGGSLTPGNLDSRSQDFESAVECLHEEQQASAYGQDSPIDAENKQAFRSFLERKARASRH